MSAAALAAGIVRAMTARAPNPYAPPIADGPAADGEASTEIEATRRAHLASETNIKSIGALVLLGAVLQVVNAIGSMSTSPIAVVLQLMLGGLLLASGLGLRSLSPWARRTYTGVLVLSLAAVVVATLVGPATDGKLPVLLGSALVSALFLWVLWNGKANVVFSEHYREVVVRQTPHLKYKTSKIALAVLVVLLLSGVAVVVAAVAS